MESSGLMEMYVNTPEGFTEGHHLKICKSIVLQWHLWPWCHQLAVRGSCRVTWPTRSKGTESSRGADPVQLQLHTHLNPQKSECVSVTVCACVCMCDYFGNIVTWGGGVTLFPIYWKNTSVQNCFSLTHAHTHADKRTHACTHAHGMYNCHVCII